MKRYRRNSAFAIADFMATIVLPVFLSVAYIELAVGFFPQLPYAIILGMLALGLIYCLLKSPVRVVYRAVELLLFLPITILFAMPDPIFRSWERLCVFVVLYMVTSPMLSNQSLHKFRRVAFITFLVLSLAIGISSFFAFFMGINYMEIDTIEDFENQPGWFGGVTRQSMILGPLSGLGALFALYMFFKKRHYYWLVLLVLTVGSVLFSASRAAFLALLVGVLAYLFFVMENRKQFVRVLIAILLVGILTFPLWDFALDGLRKKQLGHKEETELFDSRSQKVECRAREFASSPLWGVGFAAIDPEFKDYYSKTGTIEPGSSWLAILSMTGIFGFYLFMRLYTRSVKNAIANRNDFQPLILSCASLLSVHMIVEGYIFAVGSPLCFFFWLMLGECYGPANHSNRRLPWPSKP